MLPSERYQRLQKIGQGAYGSVYKGLDKQTNKLVAIKVIKTDRNDEGIPSTALREITILLSLNHPNIIKLLNRRIQIDKKYDDRLMIQLIFQYVEWDLNRYLKNYKNLSIRTIKNTIKQILIGVQYLHQQRVFHRDLKPQNVLIHQNGQIKIADFGLGRIIVLPLSTLSKEIQTLWYRAPELLLGTKKYDLKVDIWSIGCIFYEVANNKVLFQGQSEIGQIFQIFKYHGTPKLLQWPQLQDLPYFKVSPTFPKLYAQSKVTSLCKNGTDLLNKMIKLNPKERITVDQALKHQYFYSSQ